MIGLNKIFVNIYNFFFFEFHSLWRVLTFRIYLGFRNEDITGAYFEISTIDRFILYICIFRTSFSRWNLLPMAYTSNNNDWGCPLISTHVALETKASSLSPGTSCNIFRRNHILRSVILIELAKLNFLVRIRNNKCIKLETS